MSTIRKLKNRIALHIS